MSWSSCVCPGDKKSILLPCGGLRTPWRQPHPGVGYYVRVVDAPSGIYCLVRLFYVPDTSCSMGDGADV